MMPLQRHIKNVVHNYSDVERKVREATSNDPWGPSSTLMSEIADQTYHVIPFTEIMQMIWKRLNDKNKNWRHVYKALTLLEYIIKTGSENVARQCQENIHAIETLMDFYYVDEGKDVGRHVREKAYAVNTLLRDKERLQEERKKAQLARSRLERGGFGATTGSLGGVGDGSYAGLSPQASTRRPLSATERRPSSQPSLSGTAPDIESALPQSYGEEELQLQLALAISREEHEQEMRKRQEEEAKEALKLQMVLEQSKREEQNRSAMAAAQETLVSTTATSVATAVTNPATAPGGGLFNLIDTSLSAAPANAPDPWTPVALPISPPPNSQPRNVHLPHHSQSFALEGRSSVAAAATAPPSNALTLLDDAWTPRNPPAQSVEKDINPWASLDPLLTSAPGTTNGLHPSPLHNGTSLCLSATPATALGDGSCANTSSAAANANECCTSRKRDPADFLGEHKDLVDLEKLVDRAPSSTNPFAVASRSPTLTNTNPFSANLPPKPSLNELTMGATGPAPLALTMGPANSAFAVPAPQLRQNFGIFPAAAPGVSASGGFGYQPTAAASAAAFQPKPYGQFGQQQQQQHQSSLNPFT
uniref:ENTH domain-containing protein n=1 Tax=Schistocephalus solidus TaxID=70667 RepID=A0A0X3PFM0_SCHSO